MNALLTFIFPNLSTHRIPTPSINDAIQSFFPYEQSIAASAVFFCRYTVKAPNEPRFLRFFLASLLAFLRLQSLVDYRFLMVAQFCTYLTVVYRICHRMTWTSSSKSKDTPSPQQQTMYSISMTILITSVFIRVVYTSDPSNMGATLYSFLIPIPGFPSILAKLSDTIEYLFPVQEFLNAYKTLLLFVPIPTLHAQMKHLLYVTANIQVGMGFLGIDFLRKEQARKNELILLESEVRQTQEGEKDSKMESTNGHIPSNENYKRSEKDVVGKKKNGGTSAQDLSLKFQRGAIRFIIFSAVPYMAQIVFFGAVNMYAYNCFRDDLHRTVRLTDMFDMDGSRFVATATVGSNQYSPGSKFYT
jgi:hypothetical protein